MAKQQKKLDIYKITQQWLLLLIEFNQLLLSLLRLIILQSFIFHPQKE